jgi:hypothetical protein
MKAKNDIELVQEAILSIVQAATKNQISREKKDIDMQKELNNISQSIDALRRGKSQIIGPGTGVSFLGAIQKESQSESPKSEILSNFTTDFSMQKSLDTKENLNSFLNESKISKEDLMDIFANVIANAKASSPPRDISGRKNRSKKRDNSRGSRRGREYSSGYSDSGVEVKERGRILLNRSEAIYHSDDQSDDYSIEASGSQNQQYKYNFNRTSTEEEALRRSQSSRDLGRDSNNQPRKTKSASRKPDGGDRGRDRDHSDRNTDKDLTDGGDSHGGQDRDRDSKLRSSVRKSVSSRPLPRPASAASPVRSRISSVSPVRSRIPSASPVKSRNTSAERKAKPSGRGVEEERVSQSPVKRREKEKIKIRHPAPLRGARKRDASAESIRSSKGPADRGPRLEFRSDVLDSPKRQGKYGRKTVKSGRCSTRGQSQSPRCHSETDDSALAEEGVEGESEGEAESVGDSSVGEVDEDIERDREGGRGHGKGQSQSHVEDFYESNAQALLAARTASGSHLPVGYRKSLSYNSQGKQCWLCTVLYCSFPRTISCSINIFKRIYLIHMNELNFQLLIPDSDPGSSRAKKGNSPLRIPSPSSSPKGPGRYASPNREDRNQPEDPRYPEHYGSPHAAYSENITPNTVSTTSTGGTRRLRDDPVREVLTKFLDIYQTDQDHLEKRLKEC